MLELIWNNLRALGDEINKVEDSTLDVAKNILSDTIQAVEKGIETVKEEFKDN